MDAIVNKAKKVSSFKATLLKAAWKGRDTGNIAASDQLPEPHGV